MDDVASVLGRAVRMFHDEGPDCYISGPFQDLALCIKIFSTVPEPHRSRIVDLLRKIGDDIWNIATLIERMEITRELALEDEKFDARWHYFTRVDVDHFHTEFRSILDYVAQLAGEAFGLSGKLPTSFRKLLERLEKYEDKLPGGVTALLRGAKWFRDLRSVRDKMVHGGAMTMIFMNPRDGIIFQVYDSPDVTLIQKPILMYNEYTVFFDRYASLYMAHLMLFLEDMANEIFSHLALTKPPQNNARNFAPGYIVLRHWMKRLIEIQAGAATETQSATAAIPHSGDASVPRG